MKKIKTTILKPHNYVQTTRRKQGEMSELKSTDKETESVLDDPQQAHIASRRECPSPLGAGELPSNSPLPERAFPPQCPILFPTVNPPVKYTKKKTALNWTYY